MPETPDAILRALADPERLAIAGHLARSSATAAALADAVNAIVGRFSNDHAALRRYLVDAGFMDRDHGRYWRIGGRVDT